MATYEEVHQLREGVSALREAIEEFKGQHPDVFDEYDALKESLDAQITQLERSLRSLEFRGEKTHAAFNGVEITKTSKVTVHPHLLVKHDRLVFANNPNLVKAVDIGKLMTAYPGAFSSHPDLVSEVDSAEAKKLVLRGIVPKEVFDEVADVQYSTRINGLNDLRLS
jgi:hypothetical protein